MLVNVQTQHQSCSKVVVEDCTIKKLFSDQIYYYAIIKKSLKISAFYFGEDMQRGAGSLSFPNLYHHCQNSKMPYKKLTYEIAGHEIHMDGSSTI